MHEFPPIAAPGDGRLHSNLILRDKGVRLTWIPKNMCTTLKLSFGLAGGAIPADQEAAFAANPSWIHNWMFPLEPHHHRDFDWPVSVAVLRNPESRLRSAIIDKGLYQGDDFKRVFFPRLEHFAHYNKRPVEQHTMADLLAAVEFFPDRMWDIHVRSQVGFLNGRYTHLLRLEDDPASFFERIGVRLATVDSHSTRNVAGEPKIVEPGDRVLQLREKLAAARRPIRFSDDLNAILGETVRRRFADDLKLWRSLSPA